MDIIAKLEALAAGPKPWAAVTTYKSGRVRVLAQPREAMARNHAEMEARKIGRKLIDRMTGETVEVVSVAVEFRPC